MTTFTVHLLSDEIHVGCVTPGCKCQTSIVGAKGIIHTYRCACGIKIQVEFKDTYATVIYISRNEEKDWNNSMINASFTWEYQLNMYKLKFDTISRGSDWRQLKEILDFIKGTIPAGAHRDYDPETKEWFISQDFEKIVHQYLEFKLGPGCLLFFPKPPDTGLNATKTLTVQDELKIFSKYANMSVQELEKLNREMAIKVYRKLVRQYHPDFNPNSGPQMSEINMVWNSLKEGYYIK